MPPYPFRSSAGRGKSGKGVSTVSQERVVSTSAPPLDIVCWNCRASGHMQRECTQPRRSFVCLRCNKEGHFARECPEAPSAGFKGGKGKGPPKQEKRAKEKAVSRMCFLVHSPRSPHQTESAMVVQGEEGYLQAVFCVILPV